jgi:hypothetical protein
MNRSKGGGVEKRRENEDSMNSELGILRKEIDKFP